MSETAHENTAELAVRLAQHERQVRRQRRFLPLFTLAAVVTLTAAFTTSGSFAATRLRAARIDSLTVRRLVLVDTNDTPARCWVHHSPTPSCSESDSFEAATSPDSCCTTVKGTNTAAT